MSTNKSVACCSLLNYMMDLSKSKRMQYKRKWINKVRTVERHACKKSNMCDEYMYTSSSDNEQDVNISCDDQTVYGNSGKMGILSDLASTSQVNQETSSSDGMSCNDNPTNTYSYNKEWDWD